MKLKKILTIVFIVVLQTSFGQQKTTLFEAARNGDVEVLKTILKSNPEIIDVKNAEGYSALTLACYRGNEKVVQFLVKNKADVNASSTMGSPLMAAVVKGHVEIVKLLLTRKVHINETDINGTTALIYATMFKNTEIVQLLVKADANIDIKDNKGKTAFDYAIMADDDNLIQAIKTKKL